MLQKMLRNERLMKLMIFGFFQIYLFEVISADIKPVSINNKPYLTSNILSLPANIFSQNEIRVHYSFLSIHLNCQPITNYKFYTAHCSYYKLCIIDYSLQY